jgi:hypothetical protein
LRKYWGRSVLLTAPHDAESETAAPMSAHFQGSCCVSEL